MRTLLLSFVDTSPVGRVGRERRSLRPREEAEEEIQVKKLFRSVAHSGEYDRVR